MEKIMEIEVASGLVNGDMKGRRRPDDYQFRVRPN